MSNKVENIINLKCPHCDEYVIISENEINCAIFRHGIFKDSFQQINPHESKENCDRYYKDNMIFGCGKPFKIIKDNEKKYTLIKCDYI
jgi:hypothetical protein